MSKTEEAVNLKVLSLNVAFGGTLSSDEALAEAILKTGADIVGIQEMNDVMPGISRITGFYYNERLSVLSRYPIIDNGQLTYVYIEVEPGKVIAMSNIHLPAGPYMPYQLRDGNIDIPTVFLHEKKAGRVMLMEPLFEALTKLTERGVPVFLSGDFNNPSHYDWIEGTKGEHCGFVVEWPVSKELERLGFVDSFRVIHPDPVKVPGYTWAPSNIQVSANEMHDRIDFIYAGGPLKTIDSLVVGEPSEHSGLVIDPWVTDHRAVLSTFEVVPVPKAVMENDGDRIDPRLLIMRNPVYRVGETIEINFHDTLNSLDWCGLYKEGTPLHEKPAMRKYFATNADYPGPMARSGSITFDSSSLEPGKYTAYFFPQGSHYVMAQVSLEIIE